MGSQAAQRHHVRATREAGLPAFKTLPLLFCSAFLLILAPASGQRSRSSNPRSLEDKTDSNFINLGILGARVDAKNRKKGSCDAEANEAIVKFIFPTGYAARRLKIGDVITGVNGKAGNPFQPPATFLQPQHGRRLGRNRKDRAA